MKKILIYRNCSLGDFIVSLPAINIIKNLNPNSKIYFATLTDKKIGHVNPDQIPLRKKLIDKFIFFNHNFFDFYKFLKTIKQENFSKIYYLNDFVSKKKMFRDYLIFHFLSIKNKFGFIFKKPNYSNHNETFHLCKRVKKKINLKNISLKNFLKFNNYKFSKYLTISFGGKNHLKKWNSKNWENLIINIIKFKPKLKIVVLGSKNESKIINSMKISTHKNIVDLCGKTDIKKLINIIASSSYHISHDDGTMHIASTFYKKSVSIFGKSTAVKGKWFPKNPNLKIFYKDKINEIKLSLVKKKIFFDLKNL